MRILSGVSTYSLLTCQLHSQNECLNTSGKAFPKNKIRMFTKKNKEILQVKETTHMDLYSDIVSENSQRAKRKILAS